MAARGEGAAANEPADHRISWHDHGLGLGTMDCRFCAAAARTRLGRGSQPRDRVSLGRWTHRPVRRDCGRVRPAQGRYHCRRWKRGGRGKAVDIGHPNRRRARYPIATGLVASLARPGGNVTGLSNQQTDLHGKRLELLREVLPSLRRLAIMANVDYPEAVLVMREVQAISKAL